MQTHRLGGISLSEAPRARCNPLAACDGAIPECSRYARAAQRLLQADRQKLL